MARKIKPCEFCEDDHVLSQADDAGGCQLTVEIYPYNNIIGIYAYSELTDRTVELSEDIQMNYCPMCGRKL